MCLELLRTSCAHAIAYSVLCRSIVRVAPGSARLAPSAQPQTRVDRSAIQTVCGKTDPIVWQQCKRKSPCSPPASALTEVHVGVPRIQHYPSRQDSSRARAALVGEAIGNADNAAR